MQPYMKSSGITHLSLDEADLGEAALDIRHRYCKDQGHAAKPYSYPDFRLPSYIWNSEHSIRPPRDPILIGSLREFPAVRTLSIDAAALFGHQKWVPAPIQTVGALPPNLETLNLKVILQQGNEGCPLNQDRHPELIIPRGCRTS